MASTSGPYSNKSTTGPGAHQNLHSKAKRSSGQQCNNSVIPRRICDFVFRRNVDNQVYRSESFRFIQKTATFLSPEAQNSRRSFKVPVNENYIDPVDYQLKGKEKEEPAYNEIVEPYNAPYYYSDTIKDPTYYSPCTARKNSSNHYSSGGGSSTSTSGSGSGTGSSSSRHSKTRGRLSRQTLSLTKSDILADGGDDDPTHTQDLPISSQLNFTRNNNSKSNISKNSVELDADAETPTSETDALLVSIKLGSLKNENTFTSPNTNDHRANNNQYISICHIRTSPESTLSSTSTSTNTNSTSSCCSSHSHSHSHTPSPSSETSDNNPCNQNHLRSSRRYLIKASPLCPRSSHHHHSIVMGDNFYKLNGSGSGGLLEGRSWDPSRSLSSAAYVPLLNSAGAGAGTGTGPGAGDSNLIAPTFKNNDDYDYDHSQINKDGTYKGKDLPFGGSIVKSRREKDSYHDQDKDKDHINTLPCFADDDVDDHDAAAGALSLSIITGANGNGLSVKKSCSREFSSPASSPASYCDNVLLEGVGMGMGMGSDHLYSSVGRNNGNMSSMRVVAVGIGDAHQMYVMSTKSSASATMADDGQIITTSDPDPDDSRSRRIIIKDLNSKSNSKCELLGAAASASAAEQETQSHLVPYSGHNSSAAAAHGDDDGDYLKPPLGSWDPLLNWKYTINSYHLELDPSKNLESQDWFHGVITRLESEQILSATKMGSFLVRNCENSSRNHFSLSIKCSRGFIHIRIEPNTRGTYTLGEKDFPSVPYLIHHFMLHRLPIKGAEHLKLMYPVITQLL